MAAAYRQRNIGAPEGATPGEDGKIVVRAMTRQVAAAVASHQLGSYLERKIDEKLDGEAALSEYLIRKIRETIKCAYTGSLYDFLKDDLVEKECDTLDSQPDSEPPGAA